jgi:hypothetical protein
MVGLGRVILSALQKNGSPWDSGRGDARGADLPFPPSTGNVLPQRLGKETRM